jgi:predicted phage-related endonuclease
LYNEALHVGDTISSTDVPKILGMHPREDGMAVKLRKSGLVSRPPSSERMDAGQFLQEGIARWWGHVNKMPVTWWDETVRHPVYPWMVGTPDARSGQLIIEIKFVSVDQIFQWGSEDDGAAGLPPHYYLQVIWLMAVTGFPRCVVVACFGGNQLRSYYVDRELPLEAAVQQKMADFRERYLIGDEDPPIGSSDTACRYIRERFPRNIAKLREATQDEMDLLRLYANVRLEMKPLADHKKKLENELKLAVGDHDGLVWADGRFTWKNVKDKTLTDWKAIAQKFLEGESQERREELVAQWSFTKRGSRRIYFRSTWVPEEDDDDGDNE